MKTGARLVGRTPVSYCQLSGVSASARVGIVRVAHRGQILCRARRRVRIGLFLRLSIVQSPWDPRFSKRRSQCWKAGAFPVVPYLDVLEERYVLLLHNALQSRRNDGLAPRGTHRIEEWLRRGGTRQPEVSFRKDQLILFPGKDRLTEGVGVWSTVQR